MHTLELIRGRKQFGDINGQKGSYHAIGEIDYPALDAGGKSGIILYIKPCYYGKESAEVRSYAMGSPSFPHERTIDENYGETHFESYRALGFEIMQGVLAGAGRLTENPSVEEVF
jgi:hypothetical protein